MDKDNTIDERSNLTPEQLELAMRHYEAQIRFRQAQGDPYAAMDAIIAEREARERESDARS